MSSRLPPAAVALVALCAASPAVAADYLSQFRGGYTPEWEDDSLDFELGLRYWYSLGSQSVNVGGNTYAATDQGHALEAHARIDDTQTNTYLKGLAGYSISLQGEFVGPTEAAPYFDGHFGYVGADFGWNAFGGEDSGFALGPIVGYHYWNEFADTERAVYTTADSNDDISWSNVTGEWSVPFDSQPTNIHINALRLGIAGKADLNEMFEISGEAVAIPYAWINGVAGAFGEDGVTVGDTTTYQASATDISGSAFGAMGELMIGFHPFENMTIRVGGRAWYLNGVVDGTWRTATITHPSDADPIEDPPFDTAPTIALEDWISTDNPFQLLRFGGLIELTYDF